MGFHTNGAAPNREVTLEFNHVTIEGITADGCATLIGSEHIAGLVGTYTTGNTLVTGETTAGVMAEAWFE